jgi:hypothetical protein
MKITHLDNVSDANHLRGNFGSLQGPIAEWRPRGVAIEHQARVGREQRGQGLEVSLCPQLRLPL